MTTLFSDPPPLSQGLVPYRMSVEKYEAMVESGVFTKDDRLELIEGYLVAKMTKGARHSTASERLWRAINCLLAAGWHVRIEKPVKIPSQSSEPEPDVSVVRGSVDDYENRNPEPSDIALVAEVGDSSVAADQTVMKRVYAGAGIPVYWIVNLVERRLEVYQRPEGGVYQDCSIVTESEFVELVIEGQPVGRIAVADLLPRGDANQ
jgi:Uma2 family endonuclease